MAEKKNQSPLEMAMRNCYGPKMKPSQVKTWITDNVIDNISRDDNRRITLDVMGVPGCGKTSLIKDLVNHKISFNGKEYPGFKIVDIPLGQIEEMGDVLGFPVEEIQMFHEYPEELKQEIQIKWVKAVDSIIAEHMKEGWQSTGLQRTNYAPPAWVPREEVPGIILFDDGNRASQRIMKGIMQLVQDYRTIAWSIPKGWTIIFTGNPDNQFNQVTSMDNAQLTRMKHVTMVPDAVEWAKWAVENDIDSRLISYVVGYPEMMIGPERTNPRTLAEFSRAMKRYPNTDGDNYQNLMNEAYSSLDEATVHSIMVFLKRDMEFVIEPKDVIENNEKAMKELERLMKKKEPRIDIVNIINDRLYAYITADNYKFDESHVTSVQNWITSEYLPKDSAYAFIKRVISNKDYPYARKFLSGNSKLLEFVRIGFEKVM